MQRLEVSSAVRPMYGSVGVKGLMYELKKMERYLRVNLSGPGPRLMKKRIYRAAVSQRLRNTALQYWISGNVEIIIRVTKWWTRECYLLLRFDGDRTELLVLHVRKGK